MPKITKDSSGNRVNSSSRNSLQQLAKSVGGVVRGNQVEYQVKGAGYRATRYLELGDTPNFDSPYKDSRDDGRNNPRNKPINGQSLQSNSLVNLPEKPKVNDEMGTMLGANASLVNPTMGVLAGQNGTLQYQPPEVGEVKTTAEDTFKSYLNSVMGVQDKRPTADSTYNKLYKQSGLDEINKDIQNYTGQINNILAKAQADTLAVTGQGRGIPEVLIGGQQAQISKEAAIKALPLQALLANAQGNKELAQQHLDTRFKIQMQDAQNQFDYDMKIIESVRGFIEKKEERAYNEIQQEKQQAFELKKGDIAFERQQLMEQIGFSNSLKLQNVSFANQKTLKQMDISNQETAGTITGKPQTATQSAANSYANRLSQADVIIGNIGKKFTGKLAFGANLPNILQSEERQSYEQAKKNFATAVLRRESGASIAPSEFKTVEEAYFPQAGDKEDVLKNKEALRNVVINNFYNEANVARPVLPGMIIESDGKKYKVGVDGETLTEI